jgi:hypothetical protein
MGCDGFPFRWDTCRLGDGCMLQCSTVSLNVGTAPFTSPSFFFFSKDFLALCTLSLSTCLGVLLVRESSCSGDRLQRLLFTATSSPSVSRLPFSLLLYFLHHGCTSSGWGAKRSCLYPLFFVSVGFCGEVECGIAFRTLIPSLYGSRRG